MKRIGLILLASLTTSIQAISEEEAEKVIHLMNGKDLSPFYIFLKEFGREKNPDNVFSIRDGILRISGEHWGYLNTREEFENL